VVQGVILANTALEKYFKSLFCLLDEKIPRGYKGHNIANLYRDISKKITRLKLNEEFLELLFKSYSLRYPDDLKPGYNISLCAIKVLIELDFSVFEIREGFNFQSDKGRVSTRFDEFKKNNVQELLEENCYFGSSIREKLFKKTTKCYETRVLSSGELLEAEYMSDNILDDGKFMGEGLKPSNK